MFAFKRSCAKAEDGKQPPLDIAGRKGVLLNEVVRIKISELEPGAIFMVSVWSLGRRQNRTIIG